MEFLPIVTTSTMIATMTTTKQSVCDGKGNRSEPYYHSHCLRSMTLCNVIVLVCQFTYTNVFSSLTAAAFIDNCVP
jgi:hypothetical protein